VFAQPSPTGGTSLSGTPAIALGVGLSSSGGGNSCAKASSASWTLPNSQTSYYAFYGATSLSGVLSAARTYTAGTNAAGFGGVFTVTFVTNQCPPTGMYNVYSGSSNTYYASGGTYYSISLPMSTYTTNLPAASPVNGNIGYTLYGVNIYDATDGGFWSGKGGQNPCGSGSGFCPPGTDLATCYYFAEAQCGTSGLNQQAFMDDCGAHASPCALSVGPIKCKIVPEVTDPQINVSSNRSLSHKPAL
jgi:hypothetical protein